IPVPLYGVGMIVSFVATHANTGPATLNVSGLGALPIVHTTGLPLVAGDIRPGVLTILQYDGEKFQAIAGSPHLSRVGNQKLTGDFDITGDSNIAGTVDVGDDLSTGGDFTAEGSAQVDGDLLVGQSLTVDGLQANLPAQTTIGEVSPLEISRLNGVTGPVAAKNGETYTGMHNFTGATTRVATQPNGAPDSNLAASIEYVNQVALSATLPAQSDSPGKYLRTNGTNAFWDLAGAIQRRAITLPTTLVTADQTKLIDCTGTFALTFAQASVLGDGWNCYIRNAGLGDITLDPNGSEQIDGMTSYVMYPGEVRLVQCDGAALRTIVLNSFYKVFAASGNFIKPPGYAAFE